MQCLPVTLPLDQTHDKDLPICADRGRTGIGMDTGTDREGTDMDTGKCVGMDTGTGTGAGMSTGRRGIDMDTGTGRQSTDMDTGTGRQGTDMETGIGR